MNTHNMTSEPKTSNRMFELMHSDKTMMEEKYGVEVVGWCTDNGPDAKKGRRLLFEKYNWMIVLLCWAHQLNLIVGDVLNVKHELIDIMKIVLTIITWLNGEMTIYCLINRLTGPEPGQASPAVRGVLIRDTPIDVPRLKQMNWFVNYVVWEILLIWNLLYCIWKTTGTMVMWPDYSYLTMMTGAQTCEQLSQD
jgi:hypothetical protein